MQQLVLSVTELNQRARACLETEFPLLWIAGELSNLTRASSGHVYFSLKDESAQVRSVMFRNRAQMIPWQLANGQQVEVQARVSLYEARGDFQITVEGMRRAGLGRLYEAFARLKLKLEAEGLFAAERKRPLPAYPRQIGIITSPQAAALQDVLATLKRRAPHLPVVIYPTLVQGADAARGIGDAIGAAARHGVCDVLLLVRGGGSIEDLWSFNEEAVARAIASARLPVISGVGHETDLTIADFVADQRAATPTAAAELVTRHWFAARTLLYTHQQQLQSKLSRRLSVLQQRVDIAGSQLQHPATRLARSADQMHLLKQRVAAAIRSLTLISTHRLREAGSALGRVKPDVSSRRSQLDQLTQRLKSAMATTLERQRYQLQHVTQGLDHLNPAHTVARGYAIVRDAKGTLVDSPLSVAIAEVLSVELAHGRLHAKRIPDDS